MGDIPRESGGIRGACDRIWVGSATSRCSTILVAYLWRLRSNCERVRPTEGSTKSEAVSMLAAPSETVEARTGGRSPTYTQPKIVERYLLRKFVGQRKVP